MARGEAGRLAADRTTSQQIVGRVQAVLRPPRVVAQGPPEIRPSGGQGRRRQEDVSRRAEGGPCPHGAGVRRRPADHRAAADDDEHQQARAGHAAAAASSASKAYQPC